MRLYRISVSRGTSFKSLTYIPGSAGGASSGACDPASGGLSLFSSATALDSGSGSGGGAKGFWGGTRIGGVGGANVGVAE